MIRSPLAPKRPAWLWGTVVALAACTVAYALMAWIAPWRPGRFGGLLFGTVAALLFLNAMVYPARRRRVWPWRNAQQWLQFHIYGSVVATWCVFIHTGFALPVGHFGWWLWGLSVWTTLSGLFGVAVQKWMPAALTRHVHAEAIAERIPELVASLRARAEQTIVGAPDALTRVYTTQLVPLLAAPGPRWSHVFDMRADGAAGLVALRGLREFVPPTEFDRLSGLEAIVREKVELDIHASVQRLLRGWLLIHVPPALALMGLLAVHVLAVLVL